MVLTASLLKMEMFPMKTILSALIALSVLAGFAGTAAATSMPKPSMRRSIAIVSDPPCWDDPQGRLRSVGQSSCWRLLRDLRSHIAQGRPLRCKRCGPESRSAGAGARARLHAPTTATRAQGGSGVGPAAAASPCREVLGAVPPGIAPWPSVSATDPVPPAHGQDSVVERAPLPANRLRAKYVVDPC